MRQARWYYHPLFVFIFSVIALGSSLFLYIYWYMKVSSGMAALASKFNIAPDQLLEFQNWALIVVLSVLVGIILMGIFTIFVFNQKTFQLYRMQNNFINNFTHELKTPVTSLKLYLETFLDHELPREQQVKYIEYMLRDVSRLSANINSILDLARIESKSYGGEFVRADLVRFTERFCNVNQHLFSSCRIHIHQPENGSFIYPVNLSLYEMLLNNLLVNAIKYNESPNPTVDITFETRETHLRISFTDNGIGIEKPHIRKIFKKFFQVGRSDDMSARGSGLGLYMVQNIARIHNGRVTAHSEGRGAGSTFRLTLPLRRVAS